MLFHEEAVEGRLMSSTVSPGRIALKSTAFASLYGDISVG